MKHAQGGGVVLLQAVPLPAGSCLPPLQLTQRGAVTSVLVDAAVWGRIDTPVAERMAAAAIQTLKKASRGCHCCCVQGGHLHSMSMLHA